MLAWRRIKGEEFDTIEYENVSKIHLEASSISTVSAVLKNDNTIRVYVQVKSGYIKTFVFKNNEFHEETESINCGTFTFCRMSVLKCNDEIIIAYPSAEVENAVNVLIDGKRSLIKNFMSQSSGMCLFTKLYAVKDGITMICGYESGKLVVLEISLSRTEHTVLFEGRVFEESCTDADLFKETIVAVSAGKSVKILRDLKIEAKKIELPFPGCNTVAIRSDGKIFVTGGWDGKIRYFSIKSGKLLAIIDYHFDAISDIKFNDFDLLAASSDGTISLFTLYN